MADIANMNGEKPSNLGKHENIRTYLQKLEIECDEIERSFKRARVDNDDDNDNDNDNDEKNDDDENVI